MLKVSLVIFLYSNVNIAGDELKVYILSDHGPWPWRDVCDTPACSDWTARPCSLQSIFLKDQPCESHEVVRTYNFGLDPVWMNDIEIYISTYPVLKMSIFSTLNEDFQFSKVSILYSLANFCLTYEFQAFNIIFMYMQIQWLGMFLNKKLLILLQ